jgi:hypothetical protein
MKRYRQLMLLYTALVFFAFFYPSEHKFLYVSGTLLVFAHYTVCLYFVGSNFLSNGKAAMKSLPKRERQAVHGMMFRSILLGILFLAIYVSIPHVNYAEAGYRIAEFLERLSNDLRRWF